MKTKSILVFLVAVASGVSAFAQENDDMYFSSKDRAKINLRSREEMVLASAKTDGTIQTINPSDSYSARNENPDYIAGAKAGSNASTKSSYFSPSYQPNVNQNLYSNNCNCGYSNYGYNNPYGYNRYGFGSPYSSFYPYYGYGMGSFGLSYGLGYYGMGYGMSGMYGYPYMGYGYSSFGYGYSPYGYGYSYYPSTVVVSSGSVDNAGPVYGRHPSRTSSSTNAYYATTGRTARSGANGNTAYYNGSRSMSGARTMTSNQTSQYYNNAWRQSAANNRGSSWSNPSGNRSSFWGNTNSGWNNSNNGARQGWSNPSSGFGSGMRTSGFSGGGFSGGGGGGHVSGGGGGHGRR